MSDLWYWKSDDRIRGPLVTEELETIVLKHRLADSDSVRLEGSDEWIPAADIRRMFLTAAAASPSETAAKLLETAATRRLAASTAARNRPGAAGLAGRITSAAGALASSLVELVTTCFDASTSWLGRRGRMIVTAVAGVAVLIVLLSWLLTSLGPHDTSRLIEAEEIFRLVQANAPTGFPLPAEVSQRLDRLEKELDVALRDQPVSGASGSDRRSSLALRELLYAVRQMQESHSKLDDAARQRIDQSLHTASNFLSGAADVSEDPAASKPQDRWSSEIIAVLVFDAVLAVVVAGWWIMSRGRG